MATETQTTPETQTEPAKARKRALVTGASSGIGEEFARQLAAQSFDVVITARRRDRLDAIAKELQESTGATVEVIEADLSDRAGVEAVANRIARGDIDVLVNNAGFGTRGQFPDLPLDRELQELDLNIRALTELSHHALQHMRPKSKGAIINVASTGAYQPVPYMATYAATKAYVLSFSEALHEEAKRYGVTVTCLCPGGTRTEFQQVAGVDERNIPRMAFMDVGPVVRNALKAAKAGSAVATPGMINKATANLPRIAPRFVTRKIAGRMFKPSDKD